MPPRASHARPARSRRRPARPPARPQVRSGALGSGPDARRHGWGSLRRRSRCALARDYPGLRLWAAGYSSAVAGWPRDALAARFSEGARLRRRGSDDLLRQAGAVRPVLPARSGSTRRCGRSCGSDGGRERMTPSGQPVRPAPGRRLGVANRVSRRKFLQWLRARRGGEAAGAAAGAAATWSGAGEPGFARRPPCAEAFPRRRGGRARRGLSASCAAASGAAASGEHQVNQFPETRLRLAHRGRQRASPPPTAPQPRSSRRSTRSTSARETR